MKKLMLILVMVMAGLCPAVHYEWGGGDGNWNDENMYEPNGVPGPEDTVTFVNGGSCVLQPGQYAWFYALYVNDGSVSFGGIAYNPDSFIYLGVIDGDGQINLGGQFTAKEVITTFFPVPITMFAGAIVDIPIINIGIGLNGLLQTAGHLICPEITGTHVMTGGIHSVGDEYLPADINKDGKVDPYDLWILWVSWLEGA